MIIREKKESKNSDHFTSLGDKAEKQMAFYLRRYFADNDEIFVFNDISFSIDGENCQIDHLVVCWQGIYIIESKSCVGEIEYDEHDQWIRRNSQGVTGFKSPLVQAELQREILKKYLEKSNSKHNLLGYLFGIFKQKFRARRFIELIAISDDTIIKAPATPNEKVMKADKICQYIKANNDKYMTIKKELTTGLFKKTIDDGVVGFTKKQVDEIVFFIQHREKKQKEEVVSPDEDFSNLCFGKHKDHILYGKFGYYYKCKKCKRNKKVREYCPQCRLATRIKKSGYQFYSICDKCNCRALFFHNSK